MEKTHKQAIQVSVSGRRASRCLWWVGFEKRKVFRLERKNDNGAMESKCTDVVD